MDGSGSPSSSGPRLNGGMRANELVPRPVVASVDELLSGATSREPFLTSDSKSGSAFERVVIGGETLVVKHIHVDDDWTMRFNHDTHCNPIQVWASGLMDSAPDQVDHATVGVAGGLGRNGSGGAILMRDVSADLVPAGDTPLDPTVQHLHLDAMAGLFATRSARPLVNRRATEPAVLEMGCGTDN